MEGAAEEYSNRAVFSEEPEVPTLQTTGELTPLTGASKQTYEDLEKKLILRDKLAIERTKLSKERTALSYIRTGMSMMLGGIFFVGYFEHGTFFSYVGYFTVLVAIIFTLFGFLQNQRSMKVINTVIGELNKSDHIREEEEPTEEL
jgi:putative membrane protein